MKHLHCFISLLFIFCAFGESVGLSIEADTLNFKDALSMSFDELLQIKIVTASKTQRLATEITQKFDLVTKSAFEEIICPNGNSAELLQYLPGASVKVLSRNDANWGAYGGIGPKYNTFMVQGVPVDAFIDPQSLEAFAVDRIEIQRGPASVMYPNYLSQDFAGNQSPLAGTVNLILKEKVSNPQTRLSYKAGSYNTHSGQLCHENKFGRLHLVGGISYEQSDYTDYGTTDSWLNMQDNPEYQKSKFFLGATFFPDKPENHKVNVWINQTYHSGDVGRVYRKYDHQYLLFNFTYTGSLTENLSLNIKSGLRQYAREWQDDNLASTGESALKETSGVEQTIIPMDVVLSCRHLKNSSFIVGTDFQNADYLTWTKPVEQAKSTGNEASVRQGGIYAQEELQMQKLTIRAGVRYNKVEYDIQTIGGNIPGATTKLWNIFLWSAGAKFRVNDKLAFFANSGNSFMSPSLKSIGGTVPVSEKYVPGQNGQLPNPDLEPENGMGVDFGVDLQFPYDLYLDCRVFSTTITDAIIDNVISNHPSQTMSVNADGETVARGIEMSLHHYTHTFTEFANITLTKSRIKNPQNPDGDGIQVPFVPATMANLGITWYGPYHFVVSPFVHWGGLIYDSSSKVSRQSYDSGAVVNLVISKTICINHLQDAKLFIQIYNLTDNRFKMPWQFQDTGRSINAGVTLCL